MASGAHECPRYRKCYLFPEWTLQSANLALSINCRPLILILQSEAQSLKLESQNILSRKTPNPKPVLNPEPQSSSLPPQAPKPYNPKPPPPPRPTEATWRL